MEPLGKVPDTGLWRLYRFADYTAVGIERVACTSFGVGEQPKVNELFGSIMTQEIQLVDFNHYQKLALRTVKPDNKLGVIGHCAMGVSGEAGELLELPFGEKFLQDIAGEYGQPAKRLTPEAMGYLQTLPWTGNVRELRNVIERLVIMRGDVITIDDAKIFAMPVI